MDSQGGWEMMGCWQQQGWKQQVTLRGAEEVAVADNEANEDIALLDAPLSTCPTCFYLKSKEAYKMALWAAYMAPPPLLPLTAKRE